ncbi:MAG: DMT family transporter [Candidatus Babeliaceae bacterium]|nr:DMT family transporter [Candidatus Babeliaceae bacterium]
MKIFPFDIIFLYFTCAITFTLSKATLAFATPFFYTGFRMIIAGLLLVALAWWRGACRSFSRNDWGLMLQLIIFGVFIAYGFDLWALQYMTSCESAIVYNLMPLASAVISYFWFGERMTFIKWLAMGVGILALWPLILQEPSCTVSLAVSPALRIVAFLVLIGVLVSSAYGWVITRELVKIRTYDIFWVNGISMIVGGIMAFAVSFGREVGTGPVVTNWSLFLVLTAAIIFVSNGIFVNLYSFLLQRYTATFLSFAGLMTPLLVALFGSFFLREGVSMNMLSSGLFLSVSLLLFYREELRQGYVQTMDIHEIK